MSFKGGPKYENYSVTLSSMLILKRYCLRSVFDEELRSTRGSKNVPQTFSTIPLVYENRFIQFDSVPFATLLFEIS